MNSPDCGNHSTGQPRWAQLTASTRNCVPSLVGLPLVAALVADVDAGMRHHAVPRLADRIVEGHQARLALRKIGDAPQGQPSDRGLAGPEKVADEGKAHHGRGDGAEPVSQPAQERSPPQSGLSAGPEGGELETGSIVFPSRKTEVVIGRRPARPASRTPAAPPGRRSAPTSAGGNRPADRPRRRKPASRDRAGR